MVLLDYSSTSNNNTVLKLSIAFIILVFWTESKYPSLELYIGVFDVNWRLASFLIHAWVEDIFSWGKDEYHDKICNIGLVAVALVSFA